jgi:sensor histidine kinase regulating citrate/malate metabolism
MERRDGEGVLFERLGEPAVESRFQDETPVVQAVNNAFETTFGVRESEIAVLEEKQESKLQHGSGVGLWLVRWIAERSGGELSIAQTDEGSWVALRLPTPDADDSAPTLDPAS